MYLLCRFVSFCHLNLHLAYLSTQLDVHESFYNLGSTKRRPTDHPNSDRPEKTHRPDKNPPDSLNSHSPSDPHRSPKWHPYHSDGDVILRANDGTLFGADSWRLAKASDVFKDMINILNPNHSDVLQPQDG
ncbi:uncharacterized protein L199_000675 [Kwoniella botswanensis]|uniref:uncharacterized protein n=1 Tax=Kwoniella botswanensis TaxID=1268659 RepID=UPI00315DF1F3